MVRWRHTSGTRPTPTVDLLRQWTYFDSGPTPTVGKFVRCYTITKVRSVESIWVGGDITQILDAQTGAFGSEGMGGILMGSLLGIAHRKETGALAALIV